MHLWQLGRLNGSENRQGNNGSSRVFSQEIRNETEWLEKNKLSRRHFIIFHGHARWTQCPLSVLRHGERLTSHLSACCDQSTATLTEATDTNTFSVFLFWLIGRCTMYSNWYLFAVFFFFFVLSSVFRKQHRTTTLTVTWEELMWLNCKWKCS